MTTNHIVSTFQQQCCGQSAEMIPTGLVAGRKMANTKCPLWWVVGLGRWCPSLLCAHIQVGFPIWKARPGSSCFSAPPPSPGFVNNEVGDDIFRPCLRPSELNVGSNGLLFLIHQKREGPCLQDGSSKQSL